MLGSSKVLWVNTAWAGVLVEPLFAGMCTWGQCGWGAPGAGPGNVLGYSITSRVPLRSTRPPGRKQYGRALELLLQAVTAPALAGNAIVVAAYKKYVLVCLLHLGERNGLTSWDSAVMPSKPRTCINAEVHHSRPG